MLPHRGGFTKLLYEGGLEMPLYRGAAQSHYIEHKAPAHGSFKEGPS